MFFSVFQDVSLIEICLSVIIYSELKTCFVFHHLDAMFESVVFVLPLYWCLN